MATAMNGAATAIEGTATTANKRSVAPKRNLQSWSKQLPKIFPNPLSAYSSTTETAVAGDYRTKGKSEGKAHRRSNVIVRI